MSNQPIAKPRKDQCKFCYSRKCCNRIATPDLSFDEIACGKHGQELAAHADATLNGALRKNSTTSGTYKRGEPY